MQCNCYSTQNYYLPKATVVFVVSCDTDDVISLARKTVKAVNSLTIRGDFRRNRLICNWDPVIKQ